MAKETEEEIEAYLAMMMDNTGCEDVVTSNNGNAPMMVDEEEDAGMKTKDYEVTQNTEMDDNDTISYQDLNFEEWVVCELSKFNSGAITNPKVGLVHPFNYENGTWFINRWMAPPISKNTKMDNLISSHMVMYDCISNNRYNINIHGANIDNTFLDLITSDENTHCELGLSLQERGGRRQDLHQDCQGGPGLADGQGQHHHHLRGGHQEARGE